MITEDYVSFETAKLLKEKGFNELCKLYYDKYHGCVPIFVEDSKLTEYGYKELVRNDQNSISDFIASAPSLYVAMKWLREVHKIHISVEMGFDVDNHQYYFFAPSVCRFSDKSGEYETPFGEKEFNTYEEACEAAIKYCLENLV